MQKLLIIERDSKKELRDAIINNILDPKNNMRMVDFSVIETEKEVKYGDMLPAPKCYEAWCVVAVPYESDKFYNDVMGMSE